MTGTQGPDIRRCDGIAPDDLHDFAQLFQVSREVVYEGIVIVEKENHRPAARGAKAAASPPALSSDSLYSASGSESATTAPPA
jgi:hypothetical protein